LSPAAEAIIATYPGLHAPLASGGDDYELLFAAPPEAEEEIVGLSQSLGLTISQIGTIEPGAGVRVVDGSGATVSLATPGWRHF